MLTSPRIHSDNKCGQRKAAAGVYRRGRPITSESLGKLPERERLPAAGFLPAACFAVSRNGKAEVSSLHRPPSIARYTAPSKDAVMV